jgi:hypothetical protein
MLIIYHRDIKLAMNMGLFNVLNGMLFRGHLNDGDMVMKAHEILHTWHNMLLCYWIKWISGIVMWKGK